MGLSRQLIETMIFHREGATRFTQDSPVLPDVWIHFAQQPVRLAKLLITPRREEGAGKLARVLRARLQREHVDRPRRGQETGGGKIAYTQGNVVAELSFAELIRVVLPMTPWWMKNVWQPTAQIIHSLGQKKVRTDLAEDLREFEAGRALKVGLVTPEVLWLLRIVGEIASERRQSLRSTQKAPRKERQKKISETAVVRETASLLEMFHPPTEEERETVWLVNRNREARLAVRKSALAIKADAARRLFDVSCKRIAWAIVDSGIDARHPAFFRDKDKADDIANWPIHTRVEKTYDFTRIHDLLNPDALDTKRLAPRIQEILEHDDRREERIRTTLPDLRRHLQSGREIDWSLLEPLLRVPHKESYDHPRNDHGTHVAGILAANWHPLDGDPVVGVCPDIRLYDMRVLGEDGVGDEFMVIAALQFIRHLNAQRDYIAVHGANLSLSIKHDVVNFACGRTPVCEECERLVASGTTVVAAAGNQGYLKYATVEGYQEGYRTISITDPGNAEGVITVGATHRFRPHTYGVSYFSSRGPTGDGRVKPDLVAPGEKIVAPTPGSEARRKDGTSMAAPHASGAAALMMARHKELVGEPRRIKQVLCDTATDLGRERYFQGAGMLDALRALQSI
jgi:hypothetical protein